MASKNVVAMMVEKDAPYSVEELQRMDDRDCWKWVYKNKPPMARRFRDTRPQVCFTGFRPDDKKNLEDIANRSGYKVVKSVTVNIAVLVTGEAPGPAKLIKAENKGAQIMNQKQFISFLEQPLKSGERVSRQKKKRL